MDRTGDDGWKKEEIVRDVAQRVVGKAAAIGLDDIMDAAKRDIGKSERDDDAREKGQRKLSVDPPRDQWRELDCRRSGDGRSVRRMIFVAKPADRDGQQQEQAGR